MNVISQWFDGDRAVPFGRSSVAVGADAAPRGGKAGAHGAEAIAVGPLSTGRVRCR